MSVEPIESPAPSPSSGSASGNDGQRAALFDDDARLAGVDLRRLPWIRPLGPEYASNFASLAAFYAGDPANPEAWREAIDRVHRTRTGNTEIAAVLAAQQERRGAPPDARAAVAQLADPRAVAIVTGQQAGAFGGPMYTLLKAVTAIKLARQIAEQQRVPVVPIFWADAEDHDWDEIASCTVLDAEFKPRTLTLDPPDGAGEQSVGRLTLDARLERTLSDLTSALPATVFTESILAGIHAAYRPGRTMTEALALWIEGLLGRFGLVVYESSEPATKPMVSRIFSQELGTAGRTAALATATGAALAAIGHTAQVDPPPDQPALFYLDDGRTPIRRDGDHFVIGDRPVGREELIRQAEESPERFSPNVLLRSLVQDTIFPTVCYVAGPSELAYLGQLGDVYKEFGVQRPLVYARASATIVDSAAARFLRRHPIDFDQFQPQDESALNRMLQAQLPQSVEDAMRAASDALQRSMSHVVQTLPDLNPTLAGAARSTLNKMEHDLEALRNKIIQAAKRRDETLRRQFIRVQTQAFPLGHPQERTLAVVYFLNQYGPGLIDRLIDELPLDMGCHWVIAV